METIFDIIRKDFDSLWKVKMRGSTMEVTTPVATTSDKFVSVFITKRGDSYVVTDGGWISEGKYDSDLPLLNDIYARVFEYYKSEYGVNELAANNYIYYYKKTSDISMVSSLVYDMASFTSSVISASFINYQEKKEIDNSKRFQTRANAFIKEIAPRDIQIKHNAWAIEKYKSLRFHALIPFKGRLTLVSYVTGSNNDYFRNSLALANMRFEVVERDGFNGIVSNKVLLIDDTVKSYSSPEMTPIIGIIANKAKRISLPWSERDKIKKAVGFE